MTRLEHQLSDAERRIELGGPLSRARAVARGITPTPGAVIAVIALAAAVVALVVAASTGGPPDRVAVTHAPPPHFVGHVPVGVDPSRMAYAAGSVWLTGSPGDAAPAFVKRISPDGRRVLSTIRTGPYAGAVAGTGGGVWVVRNQGGSCTLVRIDPATNRVAALMPMCQGRDKPLTVDVAGLSDLLASGPNLWMLGSRGGIRLDPRTGAPLARVRWPLAAGIDADHYALAGDDLWVHAGDGRTLLVDARTGARRATATLPAGPVSLAAIRGKGVVAYASDHSVRFVDAATGRARWTVPVGDPSDTAVTSNLTVAGRTVWVTGADSASGAGRLVGLDLTTGRTRSSTTIPDLGAELPTAVGGELWYAVPGPDSTLGVVQR